jgi:hypothetical protein
MTIQFPQDPGAYLAILTAVSMFIGCISLITKVKSRTDDNAVRLDRVEAKVISNQPDVSKIPDHSGRLDKLEEKITTQWSELMARLASIETCLRIMLPASRTENTVKTLDVNLH